MTIIEVDGVNHAPLTVSHAQTRQGVNTDLIILAQVDSFDIHAAQRYSIVVTANQPVANYWVRAPMFLQHDSDNDNRMSLCHYHLTTYPVLTICVTVDPENIFAVLHYAGAPNADPTVSPGSASGTKLEESLLRPLEPSNALKPVADHIIDLNFDRDTDNNDRLQWNINGISYESPNLPTLLKILNGARNDNDFAASEHTIVLTRDEVVELRIHGSANGHSE
jgi:iron transport multicopper oxidase